MAVKVACQCGAKFNVDDKHAGKRVKCPKCSQPLLVPSLDGDDEEFKLAEDPEPAVSNAKAAAKPTASKPAAGKQAAGAAAAWGAGALNSRSHLDDLLDEAGVKAVVQGPTCPECGCAVAPNALLCIECGFNFELGRRLETLTPDDAGTHAGLSETEKMLKKAEKEIDSSPLDVDDGDFGDGPESFLIAMGALVVSAVVIAAVVGIIFFLDQFENRALVTLGLGFFFWMVGKIWLIVAGFMESPIQGICVLLIDFYTPFYGIFRLKSLWVPTLLYCLGMVGIFAGSFMAALGL